MEIVLVRHGQPDWEPGGSAVDNPHLTPYGHEQARCCAEALAGLHFDAFYTSPLIRVVETAQPIAERLRMEPRVLPWLRELELPALEGSTPEAVQDYFRKARERDLPEWWDGFGGAESYHHFHERISSGLEQLLADGHSIDLRHDHGQRLWRIPEEAKRILIVAHEGTNSALVSHLLGVDPIPWAWIRFSSAWAGITQVRTAHFPAQNADMWALDYFNRTDHMSALLDERDGRTA
jgi:broad specificity phosphatase PhoE